MKLHLPIGLLAAVLCAVSYSQAAGSYTYGDSGESGLFAKDIDIHFTGDWSKTNFQTKANCPTGNYGYTGNSSVGGILPGSAITADDIKMQVGSDKEITKIAQVVGVGSSGYASTGNKTITITGSADKNAANYTYVESVIGGNNISATTAAGYATGTYEVTGVSDSVIKFAKKSGTDKVITIDVQGGAVSQIRGGNSGHSGKIDNAINAAWNHYAAQYASQEFATEADRDAAVRAAVEEYVANAPWARNEKIEITVGGDSSVGYKEDGATIYDTEAAIYGAGGTAHSVNNDISITIKDNAEVMGNVLAGAVANTYDSVKNTNTTFNATNVNSFVNNTKITIAGDSTINGNVYGGGLSKKDATSIVKNDTEVVLAGGTINGNVYGAGIGDLVEGNTKVVIQGEGATVNGGLIYGGGEDGASTVMGDRILSFDNYTAGTGEDGYATVDWTKYQDFNALEVNNSKVDIGTLSAAYESMSLSEANVKMDRIEVVTDNSFVIKGDRRENSNLILTSAGGYIIKVEGQLKLDGVSVADNNASSGPTLISSGSMEINNSNVNLTESHTLQVGAAEGVKGTLNIKGGSEVSIGSNNAWLYGGSVKVAEGSILNLCSTNKDYNYRTLMGISGGELDVSVTDGSTLNSHATQLVMNFNDDTAVNITVDGEGSVFHQSAQTESVNYNFVIGSSGQWGENEVNCGTGDNYQTVWSDKDTQGYVANSHPGTPSDTITYICAKGTNEYGASLATVNNVTTTITASNGGKVKIDSALTYIGDIRDQSEYGDALNKQATFNIKGGLFQICWCVSTPPMTKKMAIQTCLSL